MNENLGINMSSYLEWNILLAVLSLFGNFPYGPPLSPNGIWDSFVSLSASHINNTNVVYIGGNFLCNACICKCVCGDWGSGKSLTVCGTQTHTNIICELSTHITQAHTFSRARYTHVIMLWFCCEIPLLLIWELHTFAQHDKRKTVYPIMFFQSN